MQVIALERQRLQPAFWPEHLNYGDAHVSPNLVYNFWRLVVKTSRCATSARGVYEPSLIDKLCRLNDGFGR